MKIGYFSLSISDDPFQITISRPGFQSAHVLIPASTRPSIRQMDSHLELDFGSHMLTIESEGSKLKLQTGQGPYPFKISFKMDGYWYGHGELVNQVYPLNCLMLSESPFISFDNGPAGQSCKLTPAWYSSNGVLIIAHTPVHVGINQPPTSYQRFNWDLGSSKAPFKDRPFEDYEKIGDGTLTLKGSELLIDLFLEKDVISAYQQLISIAGHPISTPPAELFIKPTWTTWARYKTEVSQDTVLNFAGEIIQNDFPYGIMEIDDRWQEHYGDISFDPIRFPDPKGMIEKLHAIGFKVTAWIIPFLDPASRAYKEGEGKGYLVRRADNSPYLVQWWQGSGALLDVTNSAALEWFRQRLQKLQEETGLDGYKFDAGEAAFLPLDAHCAKSIHANEYTHHYIDFISKYFQLTEVRSGWKNQTAPIFFRQWDKWTTWGLDNGLHSVLTGILALGLTGYPFILPDMVGGNEYDNDYADAELMIRWTQMNALLPAMQFSLAPWERSVECSEICRRYARLHMEFSPKILSIANEATVTGSPIIRPVWWLAPRDEAALYNNDQFLLGDDILVAPVIQPGSVKRDIYLPPGNWRDYWTGQVYSGPTIIKEHPAPLEILPFFLRIRQ